MNRIGGNQLHQRSIDGLLLFYPTHTRKNLSYSNHLKMTAVITFGINFIQRQSGLQDTLNLAWLHLFVSCRVSSIAIKKGRNAVYGDQPL